MSSPTISIKVEPAYLPEQSSPAEGLHTFSYTITVTNHGRAAAQLISRHWLIDDARGQRQEVKGLGVVGKQPLIAPGQSFQYSSGCRLRTPSGTMHGSFFFVSEQGERFDVPVPLFVLEADVGASSPRVLH